VGVQEIDIRVTLEAGPDTVWRLLDDSSTWPDWTPIESYKQIEPPGLDGLGEVRSFRTGNLRVRERIVERIPGERFAYVLISGLAVRDYRAEVDLEPSGQGTIMRWHTTFRPKFPGTGWVYRRALGTATRNFVDGLAEFSGRDDGRVEAGGEFPA